MAPPPPGRGTRRGPRQRHTLLVATALVLGALVLGALALVHHPAATPFVTLAPVAHPGGPVAPPNRPMPTTPAIAPKRATTPSGPPSSTTTRASAASSRASKALVGWAHGGGSAMLAGLSSQIRTVGSDLDTAQYGAAATACGRLKALAQADAARTPAPNAHVAHLVHAAEQSAIAGAGACTTMLAADGSPSAMQRELGAANLDVSHAANVLAALGA